MKTKYFFSELEAKSWARNKGYMFVVLSTAINECRLTYWRI